MILDAVIFDMDGLLVDSEPLWDRASIEVFDEIGIPYEEEYFLESMGMRIDLILEGWYARWPWAGPSVTEVMERMVGRVVTLINEQGEPLPGALQTIDFFKDRGIPMAVASSSPYSVIAANIGALGIGDCLDVISSAGDEAYGKPHPAIYLSTASKLGVPPQRCLVFEDAILGVIAAKAAQAACIAVPGAAIAGDKRLGIADYVLPSLAAFDEALWQELQAG